MITEEMYVMINVVKHEPNSILEYSERLLLNCCGTFTKLGKEVHVCRMF